MLIKSLELPGVYENEVGDMMLPALAHVFRVDIIVFNTRTTTAPFYFVSSSRKAIPLSTSKSNVGQYYGM